MRALTAIAATAYAVTLWMFAPESVWRREVETAKRNQNRLTVTTEPETVPTPEPTPEPTSEPITETEEPEATAEPKAIPEATEQSIITPQGTDYTSLTTSQLREEAKTRKLNWRPLINGKRTPLKKPQLIELLTA